MFQQLIANGIIAASIYVLVGLGFGLIYSVTRVFHFAHGVVFAAGAYFTYLFKCLLGFPILFSVVLAVGLSTLLGCLVELCVYRPLRRKAASYLISLLASLGVYVVLQNAISIVFGDETKIVRPLGISVGLEVLGARITDIQVLALCVSVFGLVSLATALKGTRVGLSMRSVASDPELASVSGIRNDSVILCAFVVGSALAGLAGVLVAFDVDMTPTMGMRALMMGVVAVVVGGIGSIPGVCLGALLLGMAQHLGVWKVSAQWQDAIAFVVLLAFLFFRPQGFLGRKTTKAEL